MKKLTSLLFLASTMMMACTDALESGVNEIDTPSMKASELFVYAGDNQLAHTTRGAFDPKSEVGYSIPDNGRYLVYYYIRIDGNIPGEDEVNLPASAYFPRTSTGKTMVSDLNHGYVQANVDWRSSSKFSKYIYSTDGSAVQSIIVEEPTLEDMVNANQGKGDDFSGYLAHKDELHFLWYACKKQDADHVWHIDGILTTKDRTDITQTQYGEEIINTNEKNGLVEDTGSVVRTAHVEVDVHQQEHKDWNEIKTSIHLRDTVTAEVFIPIDYAEQADDFDIRVGKDYEYITEVLDSKVMIGGKEYKLDVSITHEEAGIRIIVKPNVEALRAAREFCGDGITYEVHNYVTPGIPQDAIWEKLRNTTVTVSPYTLIRGQVTSAFYDDKVDF